MTIRRFTCSTLGLLLLAAPAPSALAQAGPPCGPDLPIKCTPGKSAAIVLSFVGAGALAVYLAYRIDHPRGATSIAGCATQDNEEITLVDQASQTPYVLAAGRKKVKAGERLVLRGKKNRDADGRDVFRVTKILEDQGPCEPQSPAKNDSAHTD